jgi:hypothetical protein
MLEGKAFIPLLSSYSARYAGKVVRNPSSVMAFAFLQRFPVSDRYRKANWPLIFFLSELFMSNANIFKTTLWHINNLQEIIHVWRVVRY